MEYPKLIFNPPLLNIYQILSRLSFGQIFLFKAYFFQIPGICQLLLSPASQTISPIELLRSFSKNIFHLDICEKSLICYSKYPIFRPNHFFYLICCHLRRVKLAKNKKLILIQTKHLCHFLHSCLRFLAVKKQIALHYHK